VESKTDMYHLSALHLLGEFIQLKIKQDSEVTYDDRNEVYRDVVRDIKKFKSINLRCKINIFTFTVVLFFKKHFVRIVWKKRQVV